MITETSSVTNLQPAGYDDKTQLMLQKIQTVTVIGSGTMGNGICHVFAQSGFNVHMMDINLGALDKAIATIGKNMDRQVAKAAMTEQDKAAALGHITTYTDMAEAVKNSDLVIEAATENIDLKVKIFQELDKLAPEHLYPCDQYFLYLYNTYCLIHQAPRESNRHALYEPGSCNEAGRSDQRLCDRARSD